MESSRRGARAVVARSMIAQYERVSVADVNRVLRRYLDSSRVVAAYAVPKNAGATSSGNAEMAKENNAIPPSTHEPLPPWAQHVLDHLSVPEQTLAPFDMRLSNGIRLIVQPEKITHTVVVEGQIRNNPDVQEPPGKEGIADVTGIALSLRNDDVRSRFAASRSSIAIAADVDAGTGFGVDVLSSHFERGVALLADEELHPAFNADDFAIVRQQTAGELVGEMTSPDHLAASGAQQGALPARRPVATLRDA